MTPFYRYGAFTANLDSGGWRITLALHARNGDAKYLKQKHYIQRGHQQSCQDGQGGHNGLVAVLADDLLTRGKQHKRDDRKRERKAQDHLTDDQGPEFRLVRYFLTVAEELHFGRGAARLALTQPPLSQAIQALEAMLGVKLFVRTRRSVRLTAVAKDLLPEVQRMIVSAEGLRPLAQSLARSDAGSPSLDFVSTADYGSCRTCCVTTRALIPACG